MARLGAVGQGVAGGVRRGWVGRGMVRQAGSGEVGRGGVGPGMVWQAGSGAVWLDRSDRDR
jgi:hypothetical protein